MKVLSVVGARPQFIKLAPVSRYLRTRHREVLVHTGQHYDANMSDVFFQQLGIPAPDYHLGIGSGTQGRQTGEMLIALEEIVARERPDWVIVYGDTNSTLAGALVASKGHIPLLHVEAGLRSFNRRMPEEINRIVTDHLSTILCCPTATAVANLAREGIVQGVHHTGDVMYDAVLHNADLARRESAILAELGCRPGGYLLATVHRAENTDDPARLGAIVAALNALVEPVVLPLHPRTRKAAAQAGLAFGGGVRVIAPVSYLDMLALEMHARLILTDSGGVQKEAYFLGVPCVTLRDDTEWVETVAAGWNILVGTDPARIVAAVRDLHPHGERPPFFGDGNAHRVIVELLDKGI